MKPSTRAREQAEFFLRHEKQFHLGVLPTEQSNPKTRHIDRTFARSAAEGVQELLAVDWDVHAMAARVRAGPAFREMVEVGTQAVASGHRIIFSGCGATGRLSILLESLWRRWFLALAEQHPEIHRRAQPLANAVESIMTGGDYALIRSIENFEDFEQFGRQQVREANFGAADVLIAITEGGETSSVLGTVAEATERGAKAFLLFNNPTSILCAHIERSRRAIENPRVTVLDLSCGPMAIAGSTRMQATTSEQLIAGAALETILLQSLRPLLTAAEAEQLALTTMDFAAGFARLLTDLRTESNARTMGDYIAFERATYEQRGLVTYFANECALDIFTDTTERAPTFNLPPFRKFDDTAAPPSWAFVKHPLFPTPAAWRFVLGREPRCLDWNSDDFRRMGAPDFLVASPPCLNRTQLERFHIGHEEDDRRTEAQPCVAVKVAVASELADLRCKGFDAAFERVAATYTRRAALLIGGGDAPADFQVHCTPLPSPLRLLDHLAVKLVLNTISTGTMITMGRVTGNWMSWVEVSNKKLKDRSTRLVSELCGVSYEEACYALHEALEEIETLKLTATERISPVQHTIAKLRNDLARDGTRSADPR